MDLPRAVLFDLDGTLALPSHRNSYDWRNAGADALNVPVAAVLHALHTVGYSIVYLSGRPEEAREITEMWIERHIGITGPLLLRESADNRKDAIVKREIFEAHIVGRYHVVVVFDDRNQVVQMWRDELGLTCLQVAPGDF